MTRDQKAEKAEKAARDAQAARENRDRIIETYEWVADRFRVRYADRPDLLASLLHQNDLAIQSLRRAS